jgi:hypothetical protein
MKGDVVVVLGARCPPQVSGIDASSDATAMGTVVPIGSRTVDQLADHRAGVLAVDHPVAAAGAVGPENAVIGLGDGGGFNEPHPLTISSPTTERITMPSPSLVVRKAPTAGANWSLALRNGAG